MAFVSQGQEKMSRLFAFGCSFTNYFWSTWADCLAPEFDSFENWGHPGAGNHYIFNSVMEADQRYHFGAGDTVIVCWTSIDREDRYIDNRWHNKFSSKFKMIISQSDERGFLIRDLAYIKAVKTLLESRPNVRWKFLSMVELMARPNADDDHSLHRDVMRLYSNVLDDIMPGYDKTVFAGNWPKPGADPHPTPAEHLAYVDWVLPGWVTNPQTRANMHDESINLRKDPVKSGPSKLIRL